MRTINKVGFSEALLKKVSAHFALAARNVLLFMDDRPNTVRRDEAIANIEKYRQRGWKPLAWDIARSQTDIDQHACFGLPGNPSDKVPEYVTWELPGYDAYVYIDSTKASGDMMDSLITLAHECRHAWQYYECPELHSAGVVLYFVEDYFAVPTEVDAEAEARRFVESEYGRDAVAAYITNKSHSAPEAERVSWENLARVVPIPFHEVVGRTKELLLKRAGKLGEFGGEFGEIKHLNPALAILGPAELAKFSTLYEKAKRKGLAKRELETRK